MPSGAMDGFPTCKDSESHRQNKMNKPTFSFFILWSDGFGLGGCGGLSQGLWAWKLPFVGPKNRIILFFDRETGLDFLN